jgi:hypothetical protein
MTRGPKQVDSLHCGLATDIQLLTKKEKEKLKKEKEKVSLRTFHKARLIL